MIITGMDWKLARQYASLGGHAIRRAAWVPDAGSYRWIRRPRVNGRIGALWYDEYRTGNTIALYGVCTAASVTAADYDGTDWMVDVPDGAPIQPGNPGQSDPVHVQPGFPVVPQPDPAPPIVKPQQIVLLQEHFASILQGMDTAPAGAILAWWGNDNFPLPTKAYQAGRAVKIGTGITPGSIESKVLDLSQGGGVITVTFKVKGWSLVEGGIQVSITGLPSQTVYYTATMSGSYEEKVVSFLGGQINSRVKIATTAQRAFIDDVLIVVG